MSTEECRRVAIAPNPSHCDKRLHFSTSNIDATGIRPISTQHCPFRTQSCRILPSRPGFVTGSKMNFVGALNHNTMDLFQVALRSSLHESRDFYIFCPAIEEPYTINLLENIALCKLLYAESYLNMRVVLCTKFFGAGLPSGLTAGTNETVCCTLRVRVSDGNRIDRPQALSVHYHEPRVDTFTTAHGN